MKKTLLFLILFFISLIGFSQFSLTMNGNTANDGDVFTFSSLDYAEASLEFVVTNNNATNAINMLIESVAITNTNGANMELCFGSCYPGITQGNSYPRNSSGVLPVTLAVGASSAPHGNHFSNTAAGGNPDQPVTYLFKFYEVNAAGTQIGTPIQITYVYDATASVEDYNEISYKLFPTLVIDSFYFNTAESVDISILTTQGKQVKQLSLLSGSHTIDVSELSRQLYYVLIRNQQGKRALSKIFIN